MVYKPVEVQVPVREKCVVTAPEVPMWELDNVPLSASPYDKSKATLVELEQRRAYETRLLAEMQKCQ